ncbi:hypothetical protein DYBT9623_00413 [Dyadobacter sp. CECT 9623]|uniref:Uncharacterized protein n=1 Tax=Dyadobacter linearis TaxID=2823330 RepID=A0ABM8UJL2_9BACT|nr:hypothetical protein DYBT9623_00413 [Dyadobacter sp. CECT 9623]
MQIVHRQCIDSWKWYFLQNIKMPVMSNNKICLAGNCTIYKLVIVLVFDKSPFVERGNPNCIIEIQEKLYRIRSERGRIEVADNLIVFFNNFVRNTNLKGSCLQFIKKPSCF